MVAGATGPLLLKGRLKFVLSCWSPAVMVKNVVWHQKTGTETPFAFLRQCGLTQDHTGFSLLVLVSLIASDIFSNNG